MPDCEISPTGPAGYSLDEMRRFAAASKIPMQLGPSMRAPAARTRSRSASSRARPDASRSPRPAVITTSERAPASSAASTVSSSARSGTATTTRSASPSSSRSEARKRSAEQLAAAWVDEVDRPTVGPLDRRLGEPVPPRLRVGRGSCDGDRARREERREVAPLAHAPTRARSRAMISRWISDVPSQISSSFASRNHFSTGYSREYPKPPSVCTAAQVANIATSEA